MRAIPVLYQCGGQAEETGVPFVCEAEQFLHGIEKSRIARQINQTQILPILEQKCVSRSVLPAINGLLCDKLREVLLPARVAFQFYGAGLAIFNRLHEKTIDPSLAIRKIVEIYGGKKGRVLSNR